MRAGFHLHEDLCQLTIVDREGKLLPDGESGEIVLSNLVNRGSVLLNYRIGDLGRISTGLCSCGRTTQLLSDLEGRTSEYVIRPDGSIVGPYILTEALNRVPGVVRFQLVQVSPTAFELRLATVDRKAFAESAASAETAVREILRGHDVEATYVDEVPIEPGKKYRPIVLLRTNETPCRDARHPSRLAGAAAISVPAPRTTARGARPSCTRDRAIRLTPRSGLPRTRSG